MNLQTDSNLATRDSAESAGGPYEGLVYNLFQSPRTPRSGSAVIAFTSAIREEGVTHVVRSIFEVVERSSSSRSTHVDTNWLKRQRAEHDPDSSNMNTLPHPAWASSWEHRRQIIQQLRSRFRYVGIDCPALAAGTDVLGLASLVDGVVLVVEADRTRKSQVRSAERRIEAAGGKIIGLILNKRRYPIPDRIYNLL